MRFEFDPAPDVLKNQLPDWFFPIEEYQALMDAYGVTLDDMQADAVRLYWNQFIQTADAATLAVWESLFGIKASAEDPLSFRRERLLQKMTGRAPYTYFDLQGEMTALFGDEYSMALDPVNSTLTVVVTSSRYGAFDLLYDLLWGVVPAHIEIIANQNVVNTIQNETYLGGYVARAFVQTIPPEES